MRENTLDTLNSLMAVLNREVARKDQGDDSEEAMSWRRLQGI